MTREPERSDERSARGGGPRPRRRQPTGSRVVAQMLVTLALGAAGLVAPNGAGAASISWSGPVTIDSANALSSVSCPSESLCVAVDGDGNALDTGSPTCREGA